jgi:hypothetical protein
MRGYPKPVLSDRIEKIGSPLFRGGYKAVGQSLVSHDGAVSARLKFGFCNSISEVNASVVSP